MSHQVELQVLKTLPLRLSSEVQHLPRRVVVLPKMGSQCFDTPETHWRQCFQWDQNQQRDVSTWEQGGKNKHMQIIVDYLSINA